MIDHHGGRKCNSRSGKPPPCCSHHDEYSYRLQQQHSYCSLDCRCPYQGVTVTAAAAVPAGSL